MDQMHRELPQSGGGKVGMEDWIQWLMWYLVRPGGMTGGGGRAISPSEVLKMTIPQMVFFAYEKSSESTGDAELDSLNTKKAVDEKWSSPEYREQYKAAMKLAIQKAKEGLVR